jgi:alkylation response protein AidB-like acyl-CoA dehydrogenase/protein-L-isoaspartate O-methyltransferase
MHETVESIQEPEARERSAPARTQTLDPARLLRRAQVLADELAQRPNLGLQTAPVREMERFARLGLLTAPLARHLGGLGLGLEPGTHATLLHLLAIVGGADLALGRIYEGHVNGLLLVQRYGTEAQQQDLAEDCRSGLLSGVWNTGAPQLLHLHPQADGFRFEGVKTFATGAAFVERPIVTAELPHRGWQMTLPRMSELKPNIDRSFWHPLGMESSESFGVDFSGGMLGEAELIGNPGDFYRDPMFRGGAIRFAAVQAGAVLRLHTLFAQWLEETHRGEDPYQLARLGEIAISAQEAILWVQRAAAVAEQSFYRDEQEHIWHMTECANMMRIAIERLATGVMQRVTAGVGAHGLLQPQRFERILRDLTMYLRQPAPDQTLKAVGHSSLMKASWRTEGAAGGFWNGIEIKETLPPRYFERIYSKKQDPWDFETSDYEAGKYCITLAALPRERYENAVEVGCSIGVLTQQLAGRADRLLGLDVSDRALDRARERLADEPHVDFACMQVPHALPNDTFDLIVVSEVAYYWTRKDLEHAADELAARHEPGGHLVLVHLTEYVPDYPQTGDQVHDYWTSRPEWHTVHHARHHRFRIDILERN